MNLQALRKTRTRPAAGDIFVMRPPDGMFVYGRVISTDAPGPLGAGCVLIYVYDARTGDTHPVPPLSVDRLLVRPIMTNNLPWSRGYFETIENRPLSRGDRLPQHCFKDSRGWYFDENGRRLDHPTKPIGVWGLDSFRTIDDEVSEALGIPLAPDDNTE